MFSRMTTPPRVELVPRGFTIVELLVVAGLIAVLAALITPAVIRARAAARNAAIKAEIDMLHMAVMNYRNEYGRFPPCVSDVTLSGLASRHISRLFPRANLAADTQYAFNQPQCLSFMNSGTSAFLPLAQVNQANALVTWLSGYTNDPVRPVFSGTGTLTALSGSASPNFVPPNRRPLYDFDRARISAGLYAPAGRSGSPYIYFDAQQYGTTFVHASGMYVAETDVGTNEFFNPDSFQILCAGQDGVWGPDSGDDLSNFWRGTRAQHAASSQ